MPLIQHLVPGYDGPQSAASLRLREQWLGRCDVFLPGLDSSIGAEPAALTRTGNGIFVNAPNGQLSFDSNANFAAGWTVPASAGTWDGVLFIPTRFTTRASYQIQGASNAFTMSAAAAGITVRASSNVRINVSVTVNAGDPILCIGSGANGYAAYHNGVKYTAAGGFGNIQCQTIASGAERAVALVARFPDMLEADEEIFRLLADPWGELFEPRRIWVPVAAGGGSATASGVTLRAAARLVAGGATANTSATATGATLRAALRFTGGGATASGSVEATGATLRAAARFTSGAVTTRVSSPSATLRAAARFVGGGARIPGVLVAARKQRINLRTGLGL